MEIKLIKEDTDISSLSMMKYDWDFFIGKTPYQVVDIKGYCHSIGGVYGNNCLWAYPRGEMPSYENLVEFSSNSPINWGINYSEKNYIKTKWDENETRSSACTVITRNEKPFYVINGQKNYSIPKAIILIQEIEEHPLEFNSYNFQAKAKGMKVWWRSQPAIIERYIDAQAAVILIPDGIAKFDIPKEFVDDDMISHYDENGVIADIFDKHIWWFRESGENE